MRALAARQAGVQRLNVSLDTLDAAGFQAITGRDCLADVLDGRAAREAGFAPVKLNSVVHAATPEDESSGCWPMPANKASCCA